QFPVDIGKLTAETVAALGGVAQRPFDLVARGGSLGPLGGQRGEVGFACRKRRCRLFESRAGAGFALGSTGIFGIERGFFGAKSLKNIRIVADHALLARNVAVELLQPALEFALTGADAA